MDRSSNVPEHSDDSHRRLSKCPGCGTEQSAHSWGLLSSKCQGPTLDLSTVHEHEELEVSTSSTQVSHICTNQRPAHTVIDVDVEEEPQNELQALQEENEQLQKEQRTAALRRHIAQEREHRSRLQSSLASGSSPLPLSSQSPSAAGLTHQDQDGSHNNNCAVGPSGIFTNRLTTSSLKNLLPEANFATPLDKLLRSGQGRQARTWQDQVVSHSPKLLQAYPIKSSQMFLHPSSLPNGEKILWIVDFVDSIIPRDDEHLLSSVGQANHTCGPYSPTSDTLLPTLPSYSMSTVFRVISSNQLARPDYSVRSDFHLSFIFY